MMGGEGARARDGALGGVATAPEMPELINVSRLVLSGSREDNCASTDWSKRYKEVERDWWCRGWTRTHPTRADPSASASTNNLLAGLFPTPNSSRSSTARALGVMVLTAFRRPLPSVSGVPGAVRLAGSETGDGSGTARADDEVMKWERGRAVSGCRDMARGSVRAGIRGDRVG